MKYAQCAGKRRKRKRSKMESERIISELIRDQIKREMRMKASAQDILDEIAPYAESLIDEVNKEFKRPIINLN